MNFNIRDFNAEIICDRPLKDAEMRTEVADKELRLFLKAEKDRPRFVKLRWDYPQNKSTLVLGDAWERTYGNIEFRPVSCLEKHMPWYFIATDKKNCFCLGVKTGCSSFVSFFCDTERITALVDCRNGGNGVHLGGREILLATFIYEEYESDSPIACLKDFCRKMCEEPLLPKERVYGGNNWYYAYGKSSYKQIIKDAATQAELSEDIDNRPFQVVDDCWQIHKCEGPWYPNRKFKDMKKLADGIKALGVRPGIWVRFLHNRDKKITKDMRILREGKRRYLDPTVPEVQEYIREDIKRIREWGYELIKHDFSTADLFGSFGFDLNETVTVKENWHFHDKTKTNAEIVLDFYRLIREAAGDVLIIGCNTVSHLSASLVHISRTGDDTSGVEWERTRKMGINTLAFRLAHNEVFYMCDADCVGILKKKIPWEKNRQWLHLLSVSNTPLFISCNDKISEEQRNDIKAAYKTFNAAHTIEPVDIFDTRTPKKWLIDGKITEYNW